MSGRQKRRDELETQDVLTSEEQYRGITKRLPRLTREQEQDIVQRARTGDPAAREALIISCLNYVSAVAHRYKRYLRHDEYLDLVGVGNLAVVEYLDKALVTGNPSGYLRSTAKYVMINYCCTRANLIVRQTYNEPIPTTSLDTPVFYNTLADTKEPVVVTQQPDYTFLYEAVEQLPRHIQDVLIKHYGLYGTRPESLYQLSLRMSRSVKGSVAYLIVYRALKRLRQLLAQQEGETILYASNE